MGISEVASGDQDGKLEAAEVVGKPEAAKVVSEPRLSDKGKGKEVAAEEEMLQEEMEQKNV